MSLLRRKGRGEEAEIPEDGEPADTEAEAVETPEPVPDAGPSEAGGLEDAGGNVTEEGPSDAACDRSCPYEPSGTIGQTLKIAKLQLKWYSKQSNVTAFMIFMMASVPLGMLAVHFLHAIPSDTFSPVSANGFLSASLILLPITSVAVASFICGSTLPREFHERTAFLSLPLPVSRLSFYLGKYLCGLLLSELTVMFVYGSGIALAAYWYPTLYLGPYLKSLAIAAVSVFFYSAYAYRKSAGSKKGAAFGSILMVTLAVPILLIVVLEVILQVFGLLPIPMGEGYEETLLDIVKGYLNIAGYLPYFISETALDILGPGYNSLRYVSINGALYLMNLSNGESSLVFGEDKDTLIAAAVAVVWGIYCLYKGYRKISRRDV